METRYISLREIEGNKGQLAGLPANPRRTTDTALGKLMQSIRQDRQMLEMRPMLVYPMEPHRYVVIGGNMRLEALRRMGEAEACCTIIPKEAPVGTLKRILVKDNASFGEWDWQQLADGWDTVELMQWDIMPPFQTAEAEAETNGDKDTDARRKRSQWKSARQAGESVCDLKPQPQMYTRQGRFFIASFRKTDEGLPVSKCKQADMVPLFAESALEAIRGAIGLGSTEGWALVTTPRRRHRDWNFADEVCKQISKATDLEYYPDVAEAKNRHRIDPELRLVYDIKERNVILYDDILTTGSTVKAMRELLEGKNVLVIIGINNN